MASISPWGTISTWAGTSISGMTYVASLGVPTIDKQPVEAYEQIIGQVLPVDLFNSADAPEKRIFTVEVLVRALDADTNPVTAWQHVAAGYRALDGLPSTGTLVVYSDTSNTGTVSCTARRKPLPQMIAPTNCRHIVCTLTFTCTSDWA